MADLFKFLEVGDPYRAPMLSALAWQLARPLHVRTSDDITNQLGASLTHPNGDRWAWAVDTQLYTVHPQANEHVFDPLVQAGVDAGYLPPGEVSAVQSRINAAKGIATSILNILPQFYVDSLRSYADLEAEGWFVTEEEHSQFSSPIPLE